MASPSGKHQSAQAVKMQIGAIYSFLVYHEGFAGQAASVLYRRSLLALIPGCTGTVKLRLCVSLSNYGLKKSSCTFPSSFSTTACRK
jgi:hypothetical protein